MMKIPMVLALLFAFNAHANDSHNADPFPSIVWLNQQGEVVPDDVIDVISDNCGINQAAHHIANLNDGDIEAALDDLKAAAACFEKHGFTQQSED
ncbi:hypothetical protein LRP50_15940 [Enterovibrio sp. ZSDZ42]|uniref:Uncharacterized protein n=1 Tax=Enterovibrio gelatinilyticus TaxID=2899819 RepID=A0ABT5R367_9GAMM|nr:hypothetical protein [Enterovibrio sp. ZSDZ42]MDD1794625.1 hypothetical protein [Enterovibrio sp. ZSDZ42]